MIETISGTQKGKEGNKPANGKDLVVETIDNDLGMNLEPLLEEFARSQEA